MKKLCFICFNIEDMGGINRVVSGLCNEFCKNYICILEGEISNYVIFGDNVTYYTIGTKEKITDQFYFVKDITDKNLQEKIDNVKSDFKNIIKI